MLLFEHGWCAAVADGAGSATYSRLGAAIATHVATHAVREALQHGRADTAEPALLGRALQAGATAANDALRTFATHCGLALRDLRTTLLVAALHGRKACLLEHHGLLAFEHTLDKAMWLAGEVETLAQQMVMCLSLGGPRVLPAAEIAVVVDKFSRYGLKTR